MTLSPELQLAVDAALHAESIIRRHWSTARLSRIKDDLSIVTNADTEVEESIIRDIHSAFPSHSILGEESGRRVGTSEYLWIIDPIDGTKHFARGIPLFATQIALMRSGNLILGVSHAPLLGELLYAESGKGAYSNHYPIHVSDVETLADAYISFGNISHFRSTGTLSALCHLAGQARSARGIGDAWSYHLLAQGKIDVMADARTKIWDVAAAAIIVSEAGGMLTDRCGGPIGMDTSFVVASNRTLHETVLDVLKDTRAAS